MRDYKEELAMIGVIIFGALAFIYEQYDIVITCAVALIAYIGGKRNGENAQRKQTQRTVLRAV